ncbi:Transcription factor GAMYB [Quillaja saponaria]|uniref:Transcription factor GAMYB n=1 Tax=Quillaja saponaria TaxID=32244 RepID=A0AAD7PMU3_QUISA|nr:Transcription factor GAMYB [Quillaja saponaria]
MRNETGDRKISEGHSSFSVEEATRGENSGEGPPKKGLWTSEEDAILEEYVKKHGEDDWDAVPMLAGLARSGKSCRLRWLYQLKPRLNKDKFTPEEKHRITELQAKLGNKWTKIAEEFPGHTGNSIRNYWVRRMRNLERAKPIYPADVSQQRVLSSSQENPHVGTFPYGDTQHPDFCQAENIQVPEEEFNSLPLNRSVGSSPSYNAWFPMTQPPKRPRETDTNTYQSLETGVISSDPIFSHHSLLNDNASSSEPICGPMKLELPSLQCSETQQGSWGMSASPLPSLESASTLIQSPALNKYPDQTFPCSQQNSGLPEEIEYESRVLEGSNKNSCQQTPDGFSMPEEVVKSLPLIPYDIDWEEYRDPNYPFGHSAAPVWSEYSPFNRSSFPEHDINHETAKEDPALCSRKKETKNENLNTMDLTSPDYALPDLDFNRHSSDYSKDDDDWIRELFGEDSHGPPTSK